MKLRVHKIIPYKPEYHEVSPQKTTILCGLEYLIGEKTWGESKGSWLWKNVTCKNCKRLRNE